MVKSTYNFVEKLKEERGNGCADGKPHHRSLVYGCG